MDGKKAQFKFLLSQKHNRRDFIEDRREAYTTQKNLAEEDVALMRAYRKFCGCCSLLPLHEAFLTELCNYIMCLSFL